MAKRGMHLSVYFPRLGLASLILCIISGVILTFYYRPMGDVFQNVEEITTLVPYGWFFRQLHYASGQVFVMLMLIHTVDHFLRRRYRVYSAGEWNLLIVSLGLCFFTLFTGFILKGDKEGIFAGQIFMNILKSVPLIGAPLSKLFMVPGEGFFFLPYLYHCFFLPVLIIYFLRAHIREWMPDHKFLALAVIGLFLYALIVEPLVDIPPDALASKVNGPWFFLGIQTLLKTLPAMLAGLIIPGLFLLCLLALPLAGKGGLSSAPAGQQGGGAIARLGEAVLYYLIVGALCAYGILTIRAGIRGP